MGLINILKQILFSSLIGSNYAESAEEADSEEALEFDNEGYPQLLENILELRLHRRKAILRQFMAAARCPCYLESLQKCVLTMKLQDSTSFKAVFLGPILRNIRRTI